MRSIPIFTIIAAQLFLTNASLADESYDDCKTNCAAAQTSRDVECPSPYDSPTAGQERDQCLKISRETYYSCIRDCSPPPPPPSEQYSSPMSY